MSVVPDRESSTKLRRRAERCRVIAHTYDDAETRDQMLGIALGHDQRADDMERDAKASNHRQTLQQIAALVGSIQRHHDHTVASYCEMRERISVSREMVASSREFMRFADHGFRAVPVNPGSARASQ